MLLETTVAALDGLELETSTQRTKLIVGIDYGTTYTGVAFVHQNETDLREIKTFTDWPGVSREHNEHCEKTPSVYAYGSENIDPDDDSGTKPEDSWGYEVEAGSKSYSWTKLLLDAKALRSSDDDPNLPAAISSGLLALPPGKQAVDVVADYLTKIHNHIIGAIHEKFGGSDIFDLTPIEYWLTVPAIWSDEAKFATRQAALRAGFGKRDIDEVNLISEPEAAAILALKASIDRTDDLVKVNSGVLVCDCGGGTVDITSYRVVRTQPRLVLSESSAGRGGKCGGTFIDRNLHALLSERYGEAFSSLPADRIGPNSRFMAAFEAKKQAFSLHNTRKTIKLPLKIPAFEAATTKTVGYDKKYSEIILSEQDMLDCFDPVVKKITSLVEAQLDAVKQYGRQEVTTVVLVGGLGCSRHVRESLTKWCQDIGIRMVTPWSGAWSAVARGAALHGLGAVKVQTRILRRHYGIELVRPYRKDLDPCFGRRWDSRWKDLWTGEIMLDGHVGWIVAKNTLVNDATEAEYEITINHEVGSAKRSKSFLYSCSADVAPYDLDDELVEKVGTMVINYEDVDVTTFESRWNDSKRNKVYEIFVTIQIRLGDRQGTLAVRSLVNGKQCGEASIDFSKH